MPDPYNQSQAEEGVALLVKNADAMLRTADLLEEIDKLDYKSQWNIAAAAKVPQQYIPPRL